VGNGVSSCGVQASGGTGVVIGDWVWCGVTGELLLQLKDATGGIATLDGRCMGLRNEPNILPGTSLRVWTEEGRWAPRFFAKAASRAMGSAEESQPNMFFCVLDTPPPRVTRPEMESSSIHRRTTFRVSRRTVEVGQVTSR